MGWFVIGSSMFITTVSSEHVIGYPESGYSAGFAAGNFAWGACITVILFGWVFVPIFIRNQIFTTPEFIGKRFGPSSRKFMSVLSVVVYIITKISVTLFAGAILLEALLGWDKYTSSLILVLVTGVFTVAGGLRGVMYTHVFHCYVLIIGAVVVTGFCLYNIGGIEKLASLPADHIKVFQSSTHQDYPWTGILLGVPILEIWYWCTDQYMVQRVLSAKNIPNARRGAIFSGYLMLLPSIILLVPGLVMYMKVGPDILKGEVFSSVVSEILPTGVKALAVAAMLSALISSLAASFNSTSTLFTLDIYKKRYPLASEFKIVNVGKIATLAIVIFSLIWIPFMNYFSDDIIKHLQAVQSYIAPPFTAIFLVGLIWSRANGKAALTVLITGGVLGILRLAMDIFKDSFAEGSLLYNIMEINFLHQAVALFLFYVLIMVLVSLLTDKPKLSNVNGLTIKHSKEIDYKDSMSTAATLKWKRQDIISSIVLAIFLFAIWAFLMFI